MDCIKSDLENQNYPVFAVYRMHRRDGTEIGLVLAVLQNQTLPKISSNPLPKSRCIRGGQRLRRGRYRAISGRSTPIQAI
ncbi:hypothetical protein EVAR_92619_1 [Eumeta japonica]|uniref:Uncharacterized protein n=1 Tax=Eumeta variegata TaxID=151549 RepID=A0A4C1SXK3_EUMVA|nr:hypothetical protein EVAR_92619_1 [Eumeta japonica]